MGKVRELRLGRIRSNEEHGRVTSPGGASMQIEGLAQEERQS